MIVYNHLKIENYKNIPHADLTLKPINLVIGKPGTGKTNLMEATAMLGLRYLYPTPTYWQRMVRFTQPLDWFPNLKSNKVIKAEVSKGVLARTLTVRFNEETREGMMELYLFDKFDDQRTSLFVSPFEGNKFKISPRTLLENDESCPIRPYCFDLSIANSKRLFADNYLEPPFGKNLSLLVEPNTDLGLLFESHLKSAGYRPVIEAGSGKIKLARIYDLENFYGAIPFEAISESWQRYFFLFAGLVSNQKAFLLYDNPASGLHTEHIELFAEQLAENDQNQYLISTHHPLLIKSILRHAGAGAVNIIVMKKSNSDQYESYAQSVPEEDVIRWLESASYSTNHWENG
jgi:energy-coupling factor transporter ATP-binding protein EcfA2